MARFSPASVRVLLIGSLLLIGCHRAPEPAPPPEPKAGPIEAPPSPVATAPDPAPVERTKPTLWAVVIGVDQYNPSGAVPASGQGAIVGAGTVNQWLRNAGWTNEHRLLLIDGGMDDPSKRDLAGGRIAPTRRNIRWAFDDWLKERARPDLGDVVLIYFAGQAAGLPPKDRDSGSPTREYLLPHDANLQDLETTGWTLDADIDRLMGVAGLQVVCWLDTSLQGRRRAVRPEQSIAEDYQPRAATYLDKLTRWPRVTAWMTEGDHVAEDSSPFAEQLARFDSPRTLRQILAAMQRVPRIAERGLQTRGGFDPRLTLWNTLLRTHADPEPTLVLQRGHSDEVLDILFVDEATLVTAGRDSQVKFWRPGDGLLLRDLPGNTHLAGVPALALSPDGRLLASGDAVGRVRFWDVFEAKAAGAVAEAEPRLRRTTDVSPHEQGIAKLGILPDGHRLLSWDTAGRVALWDLRGESPKLVEPSWAEEIVALNVAAGAGPVAAATVDRSGRLWLFDEALAPKRPPQGLPENGVRDALLSPDGSYLAVVQEAGTAQLWNLVEGRSTWQIAASDAALTPLAIDPSGWLVFRHQEEIRIVRDGDSGEGTTLPIGGVVRKAAFARVGPTTFLAIAADQDAGSKDAADGLSLWKIDAGGPPQRVDLGPPDPGRRPIGLAFAPDGRTLAVGDQRGGVRLWRLDADAANPLNPLPYHRGRFATASASPDGRFLLTITRDFRGEVWDLEEGRPVVRLDRPVTGGVVDPSAGEDVIRLVLTTNPDGDVVRWTFDRETGRRLDAETYSRPAGTFAAFGPSSTADGNQLIAVSPDGRRIAASSPDGRMTCLWDTANRNCQILKQEALDPDTALDFAEDSRRLLAGDSGGKLTIWECPDDGPPRVARSQGLDGRWVEAVRFLPAGIGWAEFASSHREREDERGLVCFWSAGERPVAGLDSPLYGYIRTMAVGDDGRSLVVGGSDKALWLRDLNEGPGGDFRVFNPRQLHGERVNAVAALRGGAVVSASDDATLRFWKLPEPGGRPGALGVLAPSLAEAGGETRSLDSSWIAYSQGRDFDGSPGAESQVSWLFEGQVQRLDQLDAAYRQDRIVRGWARGEATTPRTYAGPEAPRIAIDFPDRREFPVGERRVSLTIRLGEGGLRDLRLYQNGIPVRAWDAADDDARSVRAEVVLLPGVNRFHAMASRPPADGAAMAASIDGRSREDVILTYHGQVDSGRIHMLALGVGDYRNRPLRFADSDAVMLSQSIGRLATADGRCGIVRCLLDDAVSDQAVQAALAEIADACRFHPEDKVVVFLAGHTDVRDERFCLLLPGFPFQPLPDDPVMRTALLAQRGGYLYDPFPPRDEPKYSLPFTAIYRALSRVDALQRLVIVDACQAEMAQLDPGVQAIRRAFRQDASGVRTSYLLASRRGEPATESSLLRGGLLTSVLLHGLGLPRDGEAPWPDEVAAILPDDTSADQDDDREVTTDELRDYVARTLPQLAATLDRIQDEATRRGEAGASRQRLRLTNEPARPFPIVGLGPR